MLTTKQSVLRRFWYPVIRVSDLDGGPKGFTLLGENIVLWRTDDGGIACLQDRCCHRTAKLSLGYLEDGNIVCCYHGFTYRPDGACVRIPQRKNPENVSSLIRVPAYRAAARYGYVWVTLDEPLTGIPELPEAGQKGFRQVHQFYEVWNIGAFRLMENSFDSAHVAFVHRKTFGDVQRAATEGHENIVQNPFGFETYHETPVRIRGALAQKAVHDQSSETVRRTYATWYMPFVRRSAINYPHGLTHAIITCATPMTDDKAMILQWAYRNDREEDVNTSEVIAFDRAITLEDKAVLEGCEYDVPLATTDGEEMHMVSDTPGVLMRRMFAKLLADHGEAEQRRRT